MAARPAQRPTARRPIGKSAATPAADEERQDMPDDDRVGEVELMDIGREHLKPRP